MANSGTLRVNDSCCRTCLCEKPDVMLNIFDNSVKLGQILLSCTSVTVKEDDGLPKNMCEKCCKCLISFNEFKKLAESIDKKLNDIYNDEKISNSQLECNKSVQTYKEITNKETSVDDGAIDFKIEFMQQVDRESDSDGTVCEENYMKNINECEIIKFRTQTKLEQRKKQHYEKLNEMEDLKELNDETEISGNLTELIETESLLNKLDRIFICDICSISFKSQNSLSAHKKKHTKRGRILSCSICGKIFKKVCHVKRHELIHVTNDPYKCSLCSKTFNLESQYMDHINNHLGCNVSVENDLEINENEQYIYYDSIDFKTEFKHEEEVFLSDKIELDKSINECEFCKKNFKKQSSLEEHRIQHYKEIKDTNQLLEFNDESDVSRNSSEASNIPESMSVEPERNFICEICSISFKSQNSLSAHKKIHTKRGRILSCALCSKIFKKIYHLKRHERIHAKTHPYKCSLCSKTFAFIRKYMEHLNKHKIYILECEFCKKKFKSQSKLEQHRLKHYEKINKIDELNDKAHISDNSAELSNKTESVSIDSNQNFICEICSMSFKSPNSLSAHKRKHANRDRILSCSICGKVFKKVSHLKRHELTHAKNHPFKCSLCSKTFGLESRYMEHMNKHNGVKTHVCPLCQKSFTHLSTLKTHMSIHKNNRPYLCPTCGKCFHSSTNLNQHIKRHIGLKSFVCSLCPKQFVTKGELNSHIQTHADEPTCACDQCGVTFTHRSSLKKHKFRHLGIKPHQCDICPMKFTNPHHLKRHYRIHTGEKPYQCEICNKAYAQSNDLVKHRRAHLGENLYRCSECPKSFRLKTELRHHISRHYISSQIKINTTLPPSKDVKCTESEQNY